MFVSFVDMITSLPCLPYPTQLRFLMGILDVTTIAITNLKLNPIPAKRNSLGAVWFPKCNVNGNGNGLHSITSGNKFE